MFRLLDKLRRSKRIKKAREAYDRAKAAHDAAVERRDTRDQHLTNAELTRAATALLRAEVAR